MIQILFTIALCLSAALLFWIQPLFGKMILPLLGGAPAVWNTCLVFFQAALLFGYLYAHAQRKFVAPRVQIASHLCLMAAFAFLLPVSVPDGWIPPAGANPVGWLLALLSISVGLPFLILSASAPLFQNWFSLSRSPRAGDPYFLYAASNFGSLLGILGFPLLIEPRAALAVQAWLWTGGYVLLILLVAVGSVILWRQVPHRPTGTDVSSTYSPPASRWWWLLLAAVPSSLLQSVTTYITTDLASVPLLWVIPLGLYLVTFIIVFSRYRVIPHRLMVHGLPLALLAVIIADFWFPDTNLWWLLALNLAVLFVTAMVCHGELVRLRPPADRLTEFYLIIAAGGVIGGLFNLILVPLIFNSLVEYPVGLVAAGLIIPATTLPLRTWAGRAADIVLPLGLCAALIGILWAAHIGLQIAFDREETITLAVAGGIVAYACSRGRPLRFGLGLGALILAGMYADSLENRHDWQTVRSYRNFFGVLRVQEHPRYNWIRMMHNTTSHGLQICDPEMKRMPTLYFSPGGPVGDVFRCLPRPASGRKVAVAGLGTGTLAAYAAPADHWVFYEINPAVVELASDPHCFTYLGETKANVQVILGDARLAMKKAPTHYFDVIVLDAFTSDAIPVHLLTKEAIQLYLSKLAPHGLLVLHVSNRHFDLVSLLKALAGDQRLAGLWTLHHPSLQERLSTAALSSNWVVLARSPADLGCLARLARWHGMDRGEERPPRTWTDDYSNILEYLRIFRD
ncbi:MAG: fused MFS/spermidine synthase [Desulfomonilaceae bacterium]|nr:fused MFS/spermidine synthase [Desulfomonilaceae bacterium]